MILQGGFIEKLNKKFAHSPMASEDLYVAQDWLVRSQNRFYQLLRDKEPLPRPTPFAGGWTAQCISCIDRGGSHTRASTHRPGVDARSSRGTF